MNPVLQPHAPEHCFSSKVQLYKDVLHAVIGKTCNSMWGKYFRTQFMEAFYETRD